MSELRRALLEWKVLFFRDQTIERSEHRDFASRWGSLEQHPFFKYTQPGQSEADIVTLAKDAMTGGVENNWHNDVSWHEFPSFAAVLRAVEVPPVGGDTLWADTGAAYELLPEASKNVSITLLPSTIGSIRSASTWIRQQWRSYAHSPCRSTSGGAGDPRDRAEGTLRQSQLHSEDRRGARSRVQRATHPALPTRASPRIPSTTQMADGYDCVLGQPNLSALCGQRLLSRSQSDGSNLDRRRQARRHSLTREPQELTNDSTIRRSAALSARGHAKSINTIRTTHCDS